MPRLTLTLPEPHTGQQAVIDGARRFNVLVCGRRFGKTTLGLDRCVAPEVLSYPVAWFAPSYKMLLEVWREAVLSEATDARDAIEASCVRVLSV